MQMFFYAALLVISAWIAHILGHFGISSGGQGLNKWNCFQKLPVSGHVRIHLYIFEVMFSFVSVV